MNKTRIIGLVILTIGIIFHFAFEKSGIDFITGILIGIGIGLLLTGNVGKPSI